MIEVCGLRKTFPGARGAVIEAVNGVDFRVEPGEILGLLGPNGAGKTTLLRMMATLLTPVAGDCIIDRYRVSVEPGEARRRIGFLSGNTKLYGRLTPREILAYFGRLHGMTPGEIAQRTQALCDRLNMSAFLDQRCETLSTGQTQRVSIARVLLHNPPVLILDEPTLGLDILTSRTILDFIGEAKQQGHAIVFSTHYMTEAELLCDRVGLMHHGRILAMGSQESLFAQTETSNLKDAFLALVDNDV